MTHRHFSDVRRDCDENNNRTSIGANDEVYQPSSNHPPPLYHLLKESLVAMPSPPHGHQDEGHQEIDQDDEEGLFDRESNNGDHHLDDHLRRDLNKKDFSPSRRVDGR